MKGFLWLIFGLLFVPKTCLALSNLDAASLEFSRLAGGQSPLPILVELETNSSGVENGIRLTAGNNFSWGTLIQTSSSNLPEGITAIPSLANHGTINGQIVNFSSGDLQTGKRYGFYIINGLGNNPAAGNEDGNKWKIGTLVSGLVDRETEVKVAIVNNDQVSVTGVISVKQNEVALDISALPIGTLSQGQVINYNINYTSLLKGYAKPLKIVAQWRRGTVEGSPIPNVDILDYKIGSAKVAFRGAVPVIDTVSRKISWTINNFPPDLGEKSVGFSLITNDNYTGGAKVNFGVDCWLEVGGQVVTTKSVEGDYRYSGPAASDNSSGETKSDTTGLIPTKAPIFSAFKKIEISSLWTNGVEIRVLNEDVPEKLKINYGSTLNNLSNSIVSINKIKNDSIRIEGLIPGKRYYFQVEAEDIGGKITKSEVYTFTTPEVKRSVAVMPESLVVASQNSIIFESRSEDSSNNIVVIPKGKNYSIKLNLEKPELIREVKILIKNTRVLGISTVMGVEAASGESDLIEINEGSFTGQLQTPKEAGLYEIDVKITDIYGNIFLEKIGYIRVMEALRVLDEKGWVLEGASVRISRYNEKTKIYELLPSRPLSPNPILSDEYGETELILPNGKYRVEVSSQGYVTKTVDFMIGNGESEAYPEIRMEKRSFSPGDWLKYYGSVNKDVLVFSSDSILKMGSSWRFLRLMLLENFLVTIIFLNVYVGRYYGINWWLVAFWPAWWSKNKGGKIFGRVIDPENRIGIDNATISFFDGESNEKISKVNSGIGGSFVTEMAGVKTYKIFVDKKGYESGQMRIYPAESIAGLEMILPLKRKKGFGKIKSIVISKISRVFFSAWIVISLIFSYVFIKYLGGQSAILCLGMSLLNLILWISYVIVFDGKNEKIYQ